MEEDKITVSKVFDFSTNLIKRIKSEKHDDAQLASLIYDAIEFGSQLTVETDCNHRSIMWINSEIGWLCLECRGFSLDKQTFQRY